MIRFEYSASNLERPFLCLVVNNYVFRYKKVTIIAIKLKFRLKVHTSLLNTFGSVSVIRL